MPVAIAGPCPSCKKGHLVRDSEQRTLLYRGQTITYHVPGATCDECGKRFVGPSGAAAARDQVHAREAAIDARDRRTKGKPVKYQSQDEFFDEVERDVKKFHTGKLKRPRVTVSADPALRPKARRQRRAPGHKIP